MQGRGKVAARLGQNARQGRSKVGARSGQKARLGGVIDIRHLSKKFWIFDMSKMSRMPKMSKMSRMSKMSKSFQLCFSQF